MDVPYQAAILLRKLHEAGCGPIRRAGLEFRCRCPAHDDGSPSLYVGAGEGALLIQCKGGCSVRQVCDAVDHDLADLFFPVDGHRVELDEGLCLPDAAASPAAVSPHEVESLDAGRGIWPAVYSGLLQGLELSTEHFEALRRRGLSSEEIGKRGYRTADGSGLRKAVDSLLARHG